MATIKELIQAAKILKEYCEKDNSACEYCPFGYHKNCMFTSGKSPEGWEIPKLHRWSDADIQLAKALKMFGVKQFRRTNKSYVFGMGDKESSECKLPNAAFTSIQNFETVSIDSILREVEE